MTMDNDYRYARKLWRNALSNRNILPLMDILHIAKDTARRFHLRMPPESSIFANYAVKTRELPLKSVYDANPCIKITPGVGKLWVDSEYVAFLLDDESEPEYVYISIDHIRDEMGTYRRAAQYRDKRIKDLLPDEINKQFIHAKKFMRNSGCPLWVNNRYTRNLYRHLEAAQAYEKLLEAENAKCGYTG